MSGRAEARAARQPDAPELAVTRFGLPCGLDVLVHPDRSLPQVAVHMAYHVGAADDPPARSGLAHLFEHVFKNSAHLGGRHHYDILRHAGATDANAATGTDRTSYHQVLPAHQLELALWLESDRMGYFLPAMSEARLEAQKQVVRSERRQRYENVAYGAERFEVARALYPAPHPLRHLVIGEHEHIAAISSDDIAAHYQTWYVPANAHLVIAGAVEVGQARALVERYFGSFPASSPPRRAAASPALAPPQACSVADRFAALPRLHFAWSGPPPLTAEATALELLAAAWASPGTGALWQRLVYRDELAQRLSVWMVAHRLGTELHVTIDLRRDGSAAEVASIFEEELAAVRATPLAEAALRRTLGRREAALWWSLQGLTRRAQDLQRHVYWYGEPNGYARELAAWRAIDGAAVAAAAARWLDPAHRILVRTEPVDAGAATPLASEGAGS